MLFYFQILIASPEEAAEYQEIVVDPGYKILPDMTFTKVRSHLLVLSTSKVRSFFFIATAVTH